MAEKKAGRGWGALRAETPEGAALAKYLRELLDRAEKQLRDLEEATKYSKSSIQEFLSGKNTPSRRFLEDLVKAVTPPLERQVVLKKALALLEQAKNPAPVRLPATVPDTAGATAAALASVAATAQDQAAQAQQRLSHAHERNEQLTRERDKAQKMVLTLSVLTADLQNQVASLGEEHDADAEEELAKLTQQLGTAERELKRARASRDESEQMVQRIRRRSNDLEEQLAQLRRAGVAVHLSDPTGLPPMSEDLQEAFFRVDVEEALRTAEGFLDQSQAWRDEVRDEWSLATARRTPAQIIERWRTGTYLLARSLGVLAMMTAAVGHVAVTSAGAGSWTLLLDLIGLGGLVLVADPFGPIARLWPAFRTVARREPVTEPIPISARSVAIRLGRCLAALLAATGAALILPVATEWSSWWLLPLLPTVAALAVYTIVGHDRRVVTLLQEAFGDLAADLNTSRPGPWAPAAGHQRPVRLTDADWLDARRQELSDALSQGWGVAALWVKTAMIVPVVLFLLAGFGAITSSVLNVAKKSWDGSGLVAAIDQPVHAYLDVHSTGLPVPSSTLHLVWVASGAGLLLVSWLTGTFGARLTWIAWGAATVIMVYSGTEGPARPVAAGLTIIGWGIASILALQGLTLRAVSGHHVTVNNNAAK